MKLLSVDVGATLIKYAVLDEELNFSHRGNCPTPLKDFNRFIDTIAQVYTQCQNEAEGIALAIPGVVDAENGFCYGSSIMRYPHDHRLAAILSQKCGCPVTVENDGKAAVLAEFHKGELQNCQNAAVFVIGTGIGGGLIINSQLVRGKHLTAGEFSFIATDAADFADERKMLGNKCSTTYLLNRYKERTAQDATIDGIEFFNRLPDDPIAQQVLDEFALNIAIQLFNLFWLLDLEKVAIGGGISQQPIVTEKIREKFEDVRRQRFSGKHGFAMPMEIVRCRYGNDANLIGAYLSYQMHQ